MIVGVSEGYAKKLELVGVGYRAALKGTDLELQLGYSHPVVVPAPENIAFEVPSQTEIIVKGISKEQVGQVAANIRAWRKPEPYKGKGIRYEGDMYVASLARLLSLTSPEALYRREFTHEETSKETSWASSSSYSRSR